MLCFNKGVTVATAGFVTRPSTADGIASLVLLI